MTASGPPGRWRRAAGRRPRAMSELRARRRRATLAQRRARLVLALVVGVVVIAGLISALAGSSLPAPPAPHAATPAAPGDAFGYVTGHDADYIARAAAGNATALFAKSPGGVVATAARVAAFRSLIDHAVAGTGIDPDVLEAIVFVESAGRAQVIAGNDPADAAGLTQILAATGQQLLGMHINLAASRRLTAQIDAVAAGTRRGYLAPLLARRAAVDDRFDPAKELAATVRYVLYAEHQFGREDLAVESYHMGIGNLHQVLTDYNGGHPVSYAQLYFDTAPDHHATTYRLLSGFGDDSSLYYWRIQEAIRIMRLYRTDRSALIRLAALENADDAGAAALHPGAGFADPGALSAAYQRRTLVPLPANAAALGIALDPQMGAGARRLGAPRALYRGLRAGALPLLIALAARVRTLSGGVQPLTVFSAVADRQYLHSTGLGFAAAADGWSFQILRRYVAPAQAVAFQAVLDRLQSLDLVAWAREPSTIDITVASDAAAWLAAR